MKLDAAIKFFRSARIIARLLDISPQAVWGWKKTGLVPKAKAYELQVKSGNGIKVEEGLYVDAKPVAAPAGPKGGPAGGNGREPALPRPESGKPAKKRFQSKKRDAVEALQRALKPGDLQ